MYIPRQAGIYNGNDLHPSVHLLSTGIFQRISLSLRKALTVLVANLSQVQSILPGMDPSLEWSSPMVNRIAFHCRFLQVIPWIPSGRLLKLLFYLRENFTPQLTRLLFTRTCNETAAQLSISNCSTESRTSDIVKTWTGVFWPSLLHRTFFPPDQILNPLQRITVH